MLSIFHNSLEFVSKRGPQCWEILYPRLWCSPVLLTCQSCDWHEVFYCRQNFTCLNCVCIKIMNHCTTLPTQKNGLKPGYVNGFYSLHVLKPGQGTGCPDATQWVFSTHQRNSIRTGQSSILMQLSEKPDRTVPIFGADIKLKGLGLIELYLWPLIHLLVYFPWQSSFL